MKRLRHQVRARQDLAEIWSYTAERWSVEQAGKYLSEIDRRIQQLADGALKGRVYDGRYARLQAGSHMIFYRETAKELTVVRVLHTSMDASRNLR